MSQHGQLCCMTRWPHATVESLHQGCLTVGKGHWDGFSKGTYVVPALMVATRLTGLAF